ncbi:MAG: SIMPL domain-containing protein [Hyphomicrobiaceae bacterium]
MVSSVLRNLCIGGAFAVLGLTAPVVHADPINEIPQIEVSGEAEAFVKPDAMTIVMGVNSIGDNAPAAMAENAKIIRNVFQAATARGVANKDLRTARVNLREASRGSRSSKKPGARRFRAENLAYVTVRDLSLVETLLGELIEAGANRVQSVQPVVKPDFGRRQRLRRNAVSDARKMAEELATAGGVKLGKILRMTVSSPAPHMARGMAAVRSGAEPVGNVPVKPGEVRVSQQVHIVWEIVQ